MRISDLTECGPRQSIVWPVTEETVKSSSDVSDSDCAFLGYKAASSGSFFQTFRDNITVAFSGVKNEKKNLRRVEVDFEPKLHIAGHKPKHPVTNLNIVLYILKDCILNHINYICCQKHGLVKKSVVLCTIATFFTKT